MTTPPLPSPRSLEQLSPTATAAIHSSQGPYGGFALADLVEEHGTDGSCILVFLSDLLSDKNGEARHTSTVRNGLQKVRGNTPILFFGNLRDTLGRGSPVQCYNYADHLLRSMKQTTLLLPSRELLEALGLTITNGETSNTTGCNALIYVHDRSIVWVWDGADEKGGTFDFAGLKAVLEQFADIVLDADAADDEPDETSVGDTHVIATHSTTDGSTIVDFPG